MATIAELKELIKEAFPDGVLTTLDQLQLAQLIEYNRTINDLSSHRAQLRRIMESDHRKIIKEIEEDLSTRGPGFSVASIMALILPILNRAKTTNRKGTRFIKGSVRDIGKISRMRELMVFDEFGFDVDNPSNANRPNGNTAKNRRRMDKQADKTKRLMDKEVEETAMNARDALGKAEKAGLGAIAALSVIRSGLKTVTSMADKTEATEAIGAVAAGSQDIFMDLDITFYSWSSIFDSRTCPICLRLNGKIFRTDSATAPRPPAHPRCRCKALPVTNKEVEIDRSPNIGLNRDGITETGDEFLKGKSRSFLVNTLGSELKAQLFLDGLPLRMIVTNTGRIKSDKQLSREFIDKSKKALERIPRNAKRKKGVYKTG